MTTLVLTDNEIGYLRALVRQDMRKSVRGHHTLAKKLGEFYDAERRRDRLAFQAQLYTTLGGDVRNITNMPSIES